MYSLCVACVFKNEEHIIDEFILHHLQHGVEHFYMINDMSTDNSVSVVEKYGSVVTLFHNDIVSSGVDRQKRMYEKYLRQILPETEWLAIIDLDEFIFSPDDIDIKKFLVGDALRVHWRVFGSNQCFYQPLSVVSGFNKYRDPEKAKREGTHSYKTIFRSNHLLGFDVHAQVLDVPTEDSVNLFINHYQIQSQDFYINVKGTRGDAMNYYEHMNLKRDLAFFKKNDDNQIECNVLAEQNRLVTQEVKKMKIERLVNKDVTVVITACNRPHLLKRTIESFIKFNTYPIKEFIVIEDSGNLRINDFLLEYPGRWNLIYNEKNIGQVPSIDRAYDYVTTEYIFHCEEDWEFKKHGFIEESMRILEQDSKLFTVWLRPHYHTNGHPVEYTNKDYHMMASAYTHEWRGKLHTWCGFTFNPGLRRTKDVMLFHPYCVNVEKNPLLGEVDEYIINTKYAQLGFRAAITLPSDGYVDHIGANEHITRNYELSQ